MRRKRLLFFTVVLAFAGGCDHATKQIAREALDGAPIISLVGDTVRLQLTRNPGGFLSLGANLPPELRRVLFLGFAPLALFAVGWLVLRTGPASLASLLALGMIVGGGLANWGERILNDGAVTDFVSLGLGPLRTGIFNLADVYVMAGVAILLFTGFGEAPAEDAA